jgi:hypothetical protein
MPFLIAPGRQIRMDGPIHLTGLMEHYTDSICFMADSRSLIDECGVLNFP